MAALDSNVLSVSYLMEALREELSDSLLPGDGTTPDEDCLWSDDSLVRAIRLSQIAIARDATFIQDFYDLDFVAGTASYVLPDYIFEIRKIKSMPEETPIRVYDIFGQPVGDSATWRDDYGYDYGAWTPNMSEDTTGSPRYATYDEKDNTIRLMPNPDANGTWRIYVRRGPKVAVTSDSSPLELRALKYESAYLARAKYELYGQHDAETYDTNMQQKYAGAYAVEVDKLDRERKIHRGHIPVVRAPSMWS